MSETKKSLGQHHSFELYGSDDHKLVRINTRELFEIERDGKTYYTSEIIGMAKVFVGGVCPKVNFTPEKKEE